MKYLRSKDVPDGIVVRVTIDSYQAAGRRKDGR